MPRTRNEALVERARMLAAEGKTQAEVGAELGVPVRTLRTWPVEWPRPGRPRVSDEQASARTARRRRTGK